MKKDLFMNTLNSIGKVEYAHDRKNVYFATETTAGTQTDLDTCSNI